MSADAERPQGPDLQRGIPSGDVQEGRATLGHVSGEAVMLVRHDGAVYAVSATCTHWGGPLDRGLVVDGSARCPWHHARFNVRTGEVMGGPAMDGLDRWKAEERGGVVRVVGRLEGETEGASYRPDVVTPDTVVIIGTGGAGTVAAGELRHCGYGRRLVAIDPDPDASVDRPNLSKAFLDGSAPDEWLPLRPETWWDDQQVERRRSAVRRLDVARRVVTLGDGEELTFDALILATGAEPVRLRLPGRGPSVCTLRTLADARRIIAAAEHAGSVAVLGASFIGLEVAAALRARDIAVHVVAPEARPLERTLGPALGDFVRGLHEAHGVTFHLGQTARGLLAEGLELSDGTTVPADVVVLGVGVRPRVGLAEQAGLTVDDGVVVNERLETSAPRVFAAGDIARYPDPRSGRSVRIEHWVVAQRQGRTAARNVLGFTERFTDAPFFWSHHYDVSIDYVGHAPSWDRLEVDGSLDDGDAAVRYHKDGKVLALATVGRSDASLAFEAALEAGG